MKKVIFSVLMAISFISFISSGVYAGGSVAEKSSIIAGNYDVSGSTTTETLSTKGSDGAACSNNDECNSNVCEGGSCCTAHGASCDETSHCCGHQSCTDGKCP